MAEIRMKKVGTRVMWGPVITGAFIGVSVEVVLSLFGAAFGYAGLTALSAVWDIVTVPVAAFIGALAAIRLAGGEGAYLDAFMVWCLGLVFTATVLAIAPGAGLRGSAAAGLAGLAAILGFVGAIVGGGLGISWEDRRAAGTGVERQAGDAGYREERYRETVRQQPSATETTIRREDSGPQPPLHH